MNKTNIKIKAVLLDAYGTFLNTGTGSVDAAGRILARRRAHHIDPAEFYARWKQLHKQSMGSGIFLPEQEIFARDLRQLYEEYAIRGDWREDVTIMLDSLLDRPAFPEVKETLLRLGERWRLYVASNTDTAPLLQNLEYNGLHFDGIYTSESLGCYKPAPEFYLRILNAIGCQPEETIFAGDSPLEDVQAPGAIGMTTVFIDRRRTGAVHGQTYTLPDLIGLTDILR